jgi:hypothetical protein
MTCSADYAKTYIDLTTDELVDAARAQAKAEAERIKADMECHSRFLGESIYVCFPSDFFTSPREGPVDPWRKLKIFLHLQTSIRTPVVRGYLKEVVARTKPSLSIEFLVEFERKKGPARIRAFLFAHKAAPSKCLKPS